MPAAGLRGDREHTHPLGCAATVRITGRTWLGAAHICGLTKRPADSDEFRGCVSGAKGGGRGGRVPGGRGHGCRDLCRGRVAAVPESVLGTVSSLSLKREREKKKEQQKPEARWTEATGHPSAHGGRGRHLDPVVGVAVARAP